MIHPKLQHLRTEVLALKSVDSTHEAEDLGFLIEGLIHKLAKKDPGMAGCLLAAFANRYPHRPALCGCVPSRVTR